MTILALVSAMLWAAYYQAGRTARTSAGATLAAPVPALRDYRPEVPEDLDNLMARLMAKRREERPQTAAEVVEILKVLSSGDNPSLEPILR